MSRRKPDHRPAAQNNRPAAQNNRPAAAQHRPGQQRPPRQPEGTVWLYGVHAVGAALANPERRHHKALLTRDTEHQLAPQLGQVRREVVERQDIERVLPPGAVHQGVALLTESLPAADISDIAALAEGQERAVVLVLDQVTDPHNVGAILRSAAAFGALAVVVQDRHAPDETGALAKAASGALERVPVVRAVNLARALDSLKEAGFWCAGMAADAPVTLAGAKLAGRIALVLGSEGEGMRRLVRERCDVLVRLPMTSAVESLNVSNAAAVALYEIARDG